MFNRGHWKVLEDTPDGPRVKTDKKGKPTYDISGATEKLLQLIGWLIKQLSSIENYKEQQFSLWSVSQIHMDLIP